MENENEKVMTQKELDSHIVNEVEKVIREKGLDKIELKDGVVTPEGDGSNGLSKEEKIAKFFHAVVNGDRTEIKALSEGTAADGGYLVPTDFRNQVIEKLEKVSVIRPRATVIPMSRDKMDLPAAGNAVAVNWKAENTALTESNPTFATNQLDTNKLTGLAKMSRELFDDATIDIVDYVAGLYAVAFGKEEDNKFMTGSGTGQPKGIRTYTFTQTAAQAGANLVADDIVKLFYLLPVQYRTNAVWIMHNSIISKVRLLKDTTGQYLWSPGFENATPTLLGRPVLEQNDIPVNLGAGTNESEVYFGDLSYYYIGDRQQMTVETTTEGAGAFENHQVAVKVVERLDGKLVLPEAFAQLTAVK